MQETFLNSCKPLPVLRTPTHPPGITPSNSRRLDQASVGCSGTGQNTVDDQSVDDVVIGITNQRSTTVSDGFASDSPRTAVHRSTRSSR